METLIRKLFDAVGGCYSKELNISLKERDDNEIFKWFIASLLFGARIGETIAKNTYFSFAHKNILFPMYEAHLLIYFFPKDLFKTHGKTSLPFWTKVDMPDMILKQPQN